MKIELYGKTSTELKEELLDLAQALGFVLMPKPTIEAKTEEPNREVTQPKIITKKFQKVSSPY